MSSAVAINLKTESGDSYLFCYMLQEDSDLNNAVEDMKDTLQDEISYVYDWDIQFSFEDAQTWEANLNNLISKAIKEVEE